MVGTLLGYSLLVGLLLRPRIGSALGRWLLSVSAAAPLVSMAWAGTYAYFELVGQQEIGILQMARNHGALNAFAFGLCGLLGFWRATPGPDPGIRG